MSSHVTLYSCKSSPETLDKSGGLTSITQLTGEFRGSINVLNPVIQIEPTTAATVAKILTQCNYIYIQELGRYYFVTGLTCVANNMIEIEARVDVLYTWKTEILNQDVIVARNERAFSVYLDDSALKVYNNPNITTYNFRDSQGNITAFTDQQFVLALAGS